MPQKKKPIAVEKKITIQLSSFIEKKTLPLAPIIKETTPKKIVPKKIKPKIVPPKKQKAIKKKVETKKIVPKKVVVVPKIKKEEIEKKIEVKEEIEVVEKIKPIVNKEPIVKKQIEIVAPVETPQEKKKKIAQHYVENSLHQIRELIKENLYYPRSARRRGIVGEVLIEFRLSKDAEIDNITILSSKHKILSRSAIKTIQNLSSEFPKPKEDITLSIPINYSLN